MNSDKLYQLFSKYHKNTLKLPKGATLDISYDDTNKKIIFIFNNPNDVSYTKSCIEGYIFFFLEEFFELLGLGRTYSGYGNHYPFVLMGVNEIYISPELSKKTNELLSKITELDYMYFPYVEDAPIGTIYVKHVKFKYEIESSDRDRLVLKNSVKALGAKKEGEHLELDYAIDYFRYVQERDKYAESERNYIDVDYLLSTENLLYDPDWQVLYTKTVFM